MPQPTKTLLQDFFEQVLRELPEAVGPNPPKTFASDFGRWYFERMSPVLLREYVANADVMKTLPAEVRLQGLPAEVRLQGLPAEVRLQGLPAEARLQGLPAEVRLQGLPAEARLQGLPLEVRLQGLPTKDVLRAISDEELVSGLTDEEAVVMRRALAKRRGNILPAFEKPNSPPEHG